jgi:hypothetical protein
MQSVSGPVVAAVGDSRRQGATDDGPDPKEFVL